MIVNVTILISTDYNGNDLNVSTIQYIIIIYTVYTSTELRGQFYFQNFTRSESDLRSRDFRTKFRENINLS